MRRIEIRTDWRLRGPAMKKGLIVPHPIPCRLVKDADGNWQESAWVIGEGAN